MKATYRQNVRLRCGPRTRQCGGRCVPRVLNCGSQQSGNQQSVGKTVEALEDHIKDRPYESAYIVDSRSGQVLSYSTGDRFSVDIKDPDSIKGNVLTHNHPPITSDRRSDLYKGQSLSHQDVIMASYYDAKEIRAVTNSYRYSMKPKGTWPSTDALASSYNNHYSQTIKDLRRGVVRGDYNHDHANAVLWHEVNKRVAKEYNMTYSKSTLGGVRIDRAAVRCSPRTKKCGNACVPKNYQCRQNGTNLRQEEFIPYSSESTIETTESPQREEVQSLDIRKNEVVPRRQVNWAAIGAASGATVGIAAAGAVLWTGIEVKKVATDPSKFQFPSSEEDFARADKIYSQFQPGDLVHRAFELGGSYYEHYAVYAGRGADGKHQIYEFGKPTDSGIDATIAKRDIPEGKSTSFYRKVPENEMFKKGNAGFSREEVVRRAEALVGKKGNYQIHSQNCEMFARGIVEGHAYTTQGKNANKLLIDAADWISNVSATYKEGDYQDLNKMLSELDSEAAHLRDPHLWNETDLFQASKRTDSIKTRQVVDPVEFCRRVDRVAKGSTANHVRTMLYSHYLHLLLKEREMNEREQSRSDAVRCAPGNKPCGKVCIPQKYKCRIGSVGASVGEQDGDLEYSPQGLQQSTSPFQGKSSLQQPIDKKSLSQPRPHNNVGLKVAAWGLGGAAAVGAGTIGAVMIDASKNIAYKGEKPRIPKDGIPDEQTKLNYNKFKPGDLVMRTFDIPGAGTLQHFAIYAGKEGNEHYFYTQDTTGVYIKEAGSSTSTTTKSTSEYVQVNDEHSQDSPISRQRALRRAELMMGTALSHRGVYDTCETLARGVASDDWTTRQATKAGWATKAVLPTVSKIVIKGMDMTKKEEPFRMNGEEMKRFLEGREGGASLEQAKQDIIEFRKQGEKPKPANNITSFVKSRLRATTKSDSDDKAVNSFFEQTGLMTPDEFHEYAVEQLGQVPGRIGQLAFEKLLSRYLNAILTTAMVATQDKSQTKSDSIDPASAALLKKQLAAIVFRVVSRSYREKIDRFLTLDISANEIITGSILSKGSVVVFTINLSKGTVETRVAKDKKRDSIRNDRMKSRLSKSRCNTGLPCGSTCISRNSTCRMSMSQVALPGEARQMKQISMALNESAYPGMEDQSIRDLRKRASDLGVHKYSRMSKSEMISTIKAMESGDYERQRLSRSLEKKYEAERFSNTNALSDYAKDWNNANKILKIAGTSGGLTLAAAALYFYGRVQNEVKKDMNNYRASFESMAEQAQAEQEKFSHHDVIQKDGVIFAVGGYDGEGSSGHAIRGQLLANAKSGNASEFDKWIVESHDIRAVTSTKDFPPFQGEKMVNGEYTKEYLGYLAKNGIENRLNIQNIIRESFAGVSGQEKELTRNQDAIDLAAQIYAVATSKTPEYKSIDQMSDDDVLEEYERLLKEKPPKGVKPGKIRSAVAQIREARGENSYFVNSSKSISILAHGAGGGTAREALELLYRMEGGSEIAKRVKLITMSSPKMGLTEKRAGGEWNFSSDHDPLHKFQTNATAISSVRDREVFSYLKDRTVRTKIAENFGFNRSKEKKQAIVALQNSILSEMRKLEKKAKKASEAGSTSPSPRSGSRSSRRTTEPGS